MNCVDCGIKIKSAGSNTRCHDCFRDHTDWLALEKRLEAIARRMELRKEHVAQNEARKNTPIAKNQQAINEIEKQKEGWER